MHTDAYHPPSAPWTGPSVLSVDPTPSTPAAGSDPIAQALDEHQARMAVRPTLPEIMDSDEVASLLNVTARTVRGWASSGELKGFRIPGAGGKGSFRFKREDVLEFIERVPAASTLPCGCGGTLPDLASAPWNQAMADALDAASQAAS